MKVFRENPLKFVVIGAVTTFVVSYTGVGDIRQALLRTFIWTLLFMLLVAALTDSE